MVFPNPTDGDLTIYIPTELGVGNLIQVIDLLGNIAVSEIQSSENTTLNLNAFQKGLYFISIKDADGNTIRIGKIIVT
jgi:hypothetical protein